MNSNTIIVCIICLFIFVSCSNDPADPFERIEQKYDLLLGIAAINLTTGEEVYYNADTLFSTASLIKTPILAELYRQYEHGMLDPMKRLVIDTTNIYPGSGILQHMTLPNTITLQDAALLMIILSDNMATNLVFDQLGPDHQSQLDAVNTMMQSFGLTNTEMLNKPFGFDTRQDTDFARRYGIGATTPREMMKLMHMLAQGEVVSSAASADMIDIHKLQHYDDLVPLYLPVYDDTLSFAHKTGAISRARCDAGLIFSPGDTIAYAVMVDRVDDPRWVPDHKGNLAVSEAGKVMYEMLRKQR
jgi:beta-lactamase class A